MKYQVLFSLKNNNEKIRMLSAVILLSTFSSSTHVVLLSTPVSSKFCSFIVFKVSCVIFSEIGIKLLKNLNKKLCYMNKVMLTLKAPRKPASENVICLCRLLHLLANFSNLHFAYRQTVWTQIRLLLTEQSDLGPHCLQQ